MTTHIGTGGARLKATLAMTATALGIGLMAAGSAQASTVDCDGSVVPTEGAKSAKAFTYDFSCTSPQGNETYPTQIDAYTLISTNQLGGFGANALVFDPLGEVVPDQAFGCEAPIPSTGFGCFGKGGLGNSMVGSFSLMKDPCSKRALKSGPFKAWLVVAADKINDAAVHTKQTSEPFELTTPKCPKPEKGGKRN